MSGISRGCNTSSKSYLNGKIVFGLCILFTLSPCLFFFISPHSILHLLLIQFLERIMSSQIPYILRSKFFSSWNIFSASAFFLPYYTTSHSFISPGNPTLGLLQLLSLFSFYQLDPHYYILPFTVIISSIHQFQHVLDGVYFSSTLVLHLHSACYIANFR